MPALSSATKLSSAAHALSDAYHAAVNSMPHRGGALVRSDLFDPKILALTGLSLATAATLLGGSSVPINQALRDGPAIGAWTGFCLICF